MKNVIIERGREERTEQYIVIETAVGFQMSAPHLRAAMELDCTRIARGEDTKEAVVERCITMMKQCFQTCQAVRVLCRLQHSFKPGGIGAWYGLAWYGNMVR